MPLSLNSGAVTAKGLHRRLPQPYAGNARPNPYVVLPIDLQEANVVGDNLVPAPSKGCGQRRLAGTGLADKSDKTVRHSDDRRVKWDNSPLMAQHSEHGTEQKGADLAVVRCRCWIHNDLFAGPHKKSSCSWKFQQHLVSVVSSGVPSIAERCSS